jgi:hypothetical protein
MTGNSRRAGGAQNGDSNENLTALNRELSRIFEIAQGSDRGPTTQVVSAVAELRTKLNTQLVTWRNFQTATMMKLNNALRDAKLPEIAVPKPNLEMLKGNGSESSDADADEP